VCALALALASCGGGGGDDDVVTPDASEESPDASPPEETFTSFVIDQIVNQTANDTEPVSYASFATLPDPDLDNPAAYDSLF
jgi:hypothetical protein